MTLLGRHFASRVSASALRAIGLPELVATDLDAYRALATRFGGDRAANAALREKLQHQRASAPLYDSARFARTIEQAYRQMWQRHVDGAEPATLVVEETR